MASSLLRVFNKRGRLPSSHTVSYEEVGVFCKDIEGWDMNYSLAPFYPLSASCSIPKKLYSHPRRRLVKSVLHRFQLSLSLVVIPLPTLASAFHVDTLHSI